MHTRGHYDVCESLVLRLLLQHFLLVEFWSLRKFYDYAQSESRTSSVDADGDDIRRNHFRGS